jgi:CubicO group peptidase (beta-lactamase class C family)
MDPKVLAVLDPQRRLPSPAAQPAGGAPRLPRLRRAAAPARDLAKLGYLYLNGGRWDGAQVVPAGYVRASSRPPSQPPPGAPVDGYGYQWWVSKSSPTWTWSW